MSRKTSTFTLMLLAVAIALIPSVYAEYPIENLEFDQDLPGTLVAGNTYCMNLTFDNVAKEIVALTVNITVTSEPPIIGYKEIFIHEINLNGFNITYEQKSPGVFTTTVAGTLAANSHNKLDITISTAVNLMPGVYTFEVDLLGEEMTEPPKPRPPTPVLNKLPVADAGPDQTVDFAQMVEFSGVNSIDPDGYIKSWTWDFGDGTEASGVNVSHRYLESGNYTVTLTVVDVRYGEDTDTCTIKVRELVIPVPPLPPFLSDLTVTPSELELGGNVTISLDIMNPNDQAITYGFTMEIGDLTLLVDVELGTYESKTVSRTITPTAVGTYKVTVIGMTGSFTVNAPPLPAMFEVSDLSITPDKVKLGWDAIISFTVTNIGEQTGSYFVNLKIDGVPTAGMTGELEPGESEVRSYWLTPKRPGDHSVEVDGRIGSFTLEAPPPIVIKPTPPKPAEFEFSNLAVSHDEVEEGNLVNVTVDVSNVGEEVGTCNVKLILDGELTSSEEIPPLEGGESMTVVFVIQGDVGPHDVEVEGMTVSFNVLQTTEEITVWMQPGYVAAMVTLLIAVSVIIYLYRSRLPR